MQKRRRQRLIILGVAIVVLIAGGIGAVLLRNQLKAQRLENLRVEGMAAYEDERYEDALESLSDAVAGNIRDPRVLLAFADSRRRVPQEDGNNLAFAARVLDQIPRGAPERVEALEMLVEIFAELGRPTELGVTIDELLKLDPGNRLALESRVSLNLLLADDEAAKAAVEQLAESHDDFEANLLRLEVLRATGAHPADVRTKADALDDRFGDRVTLWLFKASLEIASGNVAEATAMVRRALELPVEKESDLETLVGTLDALERVDRDFEISAMEVLSPRMAGSPLSDAARRIALARAVRNGDAEAIRSATELIEAEPGEASVATLGWANVARALTSEPMNEGVAGELARRENGQWWIDLAQVIRDASSGRHADSAEGLEKIETGIGSAELLVYARGLHLAQSGDALGALSVFQAGRIVSSWRSVRTAVASLLIDQRLYLPAVAFFERQIANETQLTIGEGRLYVTALIEAGRSATTPEDRARICRAALERAREFDALTDDPGVAVLHAQALLLNERTSEAADIARQLVEDGQAAVAASLAPALRATDPELASRLEAGMDPLEKRARAFVRGDSSADSAEELIAAFDERARQSPDQRLRLQLRLAEALDAANAPEATALLRTLSQDYEDDANVQSFVLERESTWSNGGPASEAIGRLKLAAGEMSTPWRVFDARRVLAFTPDDPSERSRAIRLLSEAKRNGVLPSTGLIALSELLRLQGDESAAITELERAYEADPARVDLLPPLINRLESAGRNAEADRRLQQLQDRPTLPAPVLEQRAAILFARGDLDGAAEDYRLLAETTGAPSATIGLARILTAKGETEQADRFIRKTAEAPNASDGVLAVASEIALARGDEQRARAYAGRIEDAGRRLYQDAVIAERLGDTAAMEQALRRAIEAGEDRARDALALSLLRGGRYDEVRSILTASEAHRAFAQIATICSATEESTATEIVDGVVNMDQATPALRYAEAIRDGRRDEQFRDRLLSIVSTYPSYFPARSRLAAWFAAPSAPGQPPRDMNRAIQLMRESARQNPNDARPAAALTGLLLQARRWEEALAAARDWRARPLEDTLAADVSYAIAMAKLGRGTEALRQVDVERIKSAENVDESYKTVLAGLYLQLGRIEEARALLYDDARSGSAGAIRFVSAFDSESVPPEIGRQWLQIAGEFGESSPDFTAALAYAWLRLATQSGDAQDFAQSADGFALLKEDPSALAMYALTSEQAGRYDEAEDAYRAAIKSLPNEPALFNNLAYLLVTKRDKALEAVEFASKARDLSARADTDSRVSFLDTLGVAQLAAGQPREAEATYREARRLLATRKPGVEIGLCRALLDQGKTADAQRVYDELARTTDLGQVSDDYMRRMLERVRGDLGR